MNEFTAFFKKEWLEFKRSHRLLAFAILFGVFGLMAPAMAKLTPIILKALKDDPSMQGFGTIDIKDPVALDSYMQFFKNLPILTIVAVILYSGSFTNEFTKGTGTLMLTKGLSKRKMLFTKYLMWNLTVFGGVAFCFGLFFAYTAFYFKLTNLGGLLLATLLYLIFIWYILTLILFFSSLAKSGGMVLLGTGAVFFLSSLITMIPGIEKYIPNSLTNGLPFAEDPSLIKDYIPALIITLLANVAMIVAASIFVKKRKV